MTWPDVAALVRREPASTAFIDRWVERERVARRPGVADRRPVPYDSVSPALKRAVLVAEDIDFFSHNGFAIGEIRIAVAEAIDAREAPRGASTITQQLAKNLWLSSSRNPLRKVEEAILTRQLERLLPKKRILEIYLNAVEFGPGVYGAEAASRRYFGKAASELDEDEAARLAAALPNPRAWNPAARSAQAEWRARLIRSRMDKARFLLGEI